MKVELLAAGEPSSASADRVVIRDSSGRPLVLIFELKPDDLVIRNVGDPDFADLLVAFGLGPAPETIRLAAKTLAY